MWLLLGSLIIGLIVQIVVYREFYIAIYPFLLATVAIRNNKVFHVEFDDEFLYLIRKDADVLIPLQNIKDIELKTLGGLYEIKLYHPEEVGDKIYCKPSLLYPFNFKSKDKVANILRHKVELAKRKPQVFQRNALMC